MGREENTGFGQPGHLPEKESWAGREPLKVEMHETAKDLILPLSFPWERNSSTISHNWILIKNALQL